MKQIYTYILLFILHPIGAYSAVQAKSSSKLSDYFIENRGQVKDEKGNSLSNVLFYQSGPTGMQLFITTTGYSIVVRENTAAGTTYNKIEFKFEKADISKDRVIFVKGENPAINIYQPGNAMAGITTAKAVIVKNIYPGIDWFWSIDEHGLPSHDFMVNIGADASIIHYTVEGAKIDNTAGNILKYINPEFRVKEGPVIYEYNKKEIRGQVLVKGNTVSFGLTEELKKGGFTIDPPLQLDWSHGFDTVSLTAFRSIITDAKLNSFTVGYSGDYSLPTLPQVGGSFVNSQPSNYSYDAVIMKADSNQNVVWATFFGGAGADEANAVTASPAGIFVTGYSESWNFPQAVLGNYNSPVALFNRDAFIAKFDDVGLLKWSTGYGGSGKDEALAIQYYNGNIFIGGYTFSGDFPTMQDSTGGYFYQNPALTRADAFLLEFDTMGNRQWATCFGGSGGDYFSSLSVDASGIYVTGYSDSITGNSIPLVSNGSAYYQNGFHNTESFITHFNNSNLLDWSTYYGGNGNDVASCIVHNSCELLICGKTDGTGLPVRDQGNGNYFQPAFAGGGSDGFIAGFDPNTYQQLYGTYYGGAGYDALTRFASDNSCNTIFTGFTNGPLALQGDTSVYFIQTQIKGGGFDGIMMGMDGAQNIFWATYYGSTGNDFGLDVALFHLPVVDMVGIDFYNYGNDTIGGTNLSQAKSAFPMPDVTSDGVSNRFNQIAGEPPPVGQPSCSNLLQYQSLIPLKNTCPQQCNGSAEINIDNVGGCPPIKSFWSNGDTTLKTATLCEQYWNIISDANGAYKKLYGKFDVLNVPAVPAVVTHCGIEPNWYNYITPAGGGPPYTIQFRGVSTDSCPNTAYFNISDTAGCTVSYSITWFESNVNVNNVLSFDTNSCKMVINTSFGSNCPDYAYSNTWKYHITSPSGTNFDVPFSNHGTNVTIPFDNFATGSYYAGNYSASLDMGDCLASSNDLFFYPKPVISVKTTTGCDSVGASAVVTITADTALLRLIGPYTIQFGIPDPLGSPDGNPADIPVNYNNVLVTGNNTVTYPYLSSVGLPSLGYTIFATVIQHQTVEGPCGTATLQFAVTQPAIYLDSFTLYCGRADTLKASVVNGIYPYTFVWSPSGPNDSSNFISQPGTYSVSVTDSTGCTFSASVSIPGSAKLVIDSVLENQNPCDSALFSTATVIDSGGTIPYVYLWSSGESASTAAALPPGTNWVTISDRNGCRDSVAFLNTKQPALVVTDSSANPSCSAIHNGYINLNVSNGYLPYQVQWNGAQTGYTLTGLAGGSYSYTVTDNKQCSRTATIVLVQPDTISYHVVGLIPAACSSKTGGVQIAASGGTGSLSISWSDAGTGFVRDSLASGTYRFTITDANGCNKSGAVVIGSAQTLSVTVMTNDANCYGDSSGFAWIKVFSGLQPINYLWSNESSADTLKNLPQGLYSVTVTDANGCIFSTNFNINQPSYPLTTYIDAETDATCVGGGNDGYADASVYGGTYPYNIYWLNNGGSALSYIYNVPAGHYTYTVIDNNGCRDTGSVTINHQNGWQSTVITTSACSGNNGTATVQTVTPYYLYDAFYYSWFDQFNNYISSADTLTNLAPGNYSVDITDNYGCDTLIYFTIGQGTIDFTVSVDTTNGISCYGSQASVYVYANGNNGPFTGTGYYGFPAGLNIVQVSDQTGCAVTDTIKLWQPDQLSSQTTVTPAGCNSNIGSVLLSTSGGVGSYTAYFNNHYYYYTDTVTLSGAVGNYNIQVYDVNECYTTVPFSITATPRLNATLTVANVSCYGYNNGSASVTVNSGQAPYTFAWSDNSTSAQLQNLIAGTYSVTVTAANGCVFDSTFVITQPESGITYTNDTSKPITCFGGSTTVMVSASGGTGFITGTGSYQFYAGNNYVTLQDQAGCSVTDSFMLSQPAVLLTTYNIITPGCSFSNGVIQLNTTGGTAPYSVLFNDNSYVYHDTISLTGVLPGTYQLNTQDSNFCQYNFTVNVQADSVLVASASGSNPVCSGSATGSTTISIVTGTGPFYVNGYSFTDSIVFNNLSAGSYTYSVTNAGGCSSNVQFTLYNPPQLFGGYNMVQNAHCFGDSAIVSVFAEGGTPPYQGTGNYTFAAGNWQQLITDTNGCTANVNIYVSSPSPITASYTVLQPVVCSGGNGVVNIIASGGTQPITGTGGVVVPGGELQQILIDNNGCKDTLSISINPPPLMVSDSILQNPFCSYGNGTVLITASGGVGPYMIQGSTTPFFDTISQILPFGYLSGSQTLQVTDSVGCSQSVSFTFRQGIELNATFIDVNPGCYGLSNGQVTLIMTNGFTPYIINGHAYDTTVIQFDSLPVGSYGYHVTDSLGCANDLSTNLTQPNKLLIDSDFLQARVTCAGRKDAVAGIVATGGTLQYSYALMDTSGNGFLQSSNIFSSLGVGNYEAIVIDSNGCIDSMAVTVPAFISGHDSIVVDSALCYGSSNGEIKVYPLPADRNPYSFSLNEGVPQVFNTFNNLSAGSYQVIVSDVNSCADTLHVSIGQPDSIDSRVWLDSVLLPVDSTILTSRNYAYFVKHNANPWAISFSPVTQYLSNTDSLITVQPREDEAYTITVYLDSNHLNCFFQYTGFIEVLYIPELPNTITPNGDGFNDVWKIDLIKYPSPVLTVFDRWGEVVYTSTNYNNDWGGVDQKNGKRLPDGTYYYILQVPSLNNMIYKGDINIVDAPR